MGEPAENQTERGGIEGKVLTHPAFQKARELANPESGFYRALAAIEKDYRALEEENARLREELKAKKSVDWTDFDQSLARLEEDLRAEKERNARLEPLAITDGMTGAYNHRYFMEQLETEIKRSNRNKRPLALLFTDIDNYTDFNNTYGHQAGDYVLQELVRISKGVLRETDIFARYGGEEFVAIMPDASEEEAEIAAERLRKVIENTKLYYKGQELNFTISIGVAPHRSESSDDLITNADKLMYLAKDLGKNCVVSRKFAEDELDVDLSLYSGKKQ